ncbi:hypothetical protein H4R23_002335 [Coemansia sp. Cherry 401B]|nr:hypothetical protein H4R23_002335 [Coemansia sp. Cherry 401B]
MEVRKQKVAKKLLHYIPAVRGSHPLSLGDEYRLHRQKFFLEHSGITDTPTRRFQPLQIDDKSFNLKYVFGESALFNPRQSNIRFIGNERVFEHEFKFNKSSNTADELLDLLCLYVQFLYTTTTSERGKYMGDFFYIMKAIRQRENGHRRLIKTKKLMQPIQSYLLLCNQPNLSLYLAREYVTTTQASSLDRWHIVRLLENPRMYQPAMKEMRAIAQVAEGSPPTVPLGVEYRFNLIAEALYRYYSSYAKDTTTDAELIYLIRCLEARHIRHYLRDMLAMVVRRLYEGTAAALSDMVKVELYYEPDVMAMRVEAYQLALRYALALLRGDSVDSCLRMLYTIADMPGRPCGDLYGNTKDAAWALIRLVEAGGDSLATAENILRMLGENMIESPSMRGANEHHVRGRLQEYIATLKSLNPETRMHLADLVKAPEPLIDSAEAMRTLEFMSRNGRDASAFGWIASNFNGLDSEAQSCVIKWITNRLTTNRTRVVKFIASYAGMDPLKCAQFVHVLCRRLWERESDRRYILATALPAITQQKNADSIGVLLVTAAMGPDTPVLSPFGPQSVRDRARATTKLIERVSNAVVASLNVMMPYLFKVVSSLGATDTERTLRIEMLRQGIMPDWRMLQAAISLRTSKQIDYEQIVELIDHVLRIYPVQSTGASGKPWPSEQSALYMTILKGLNLCGLLEPFSLLAAEMLKSPRLNPRTFGALASTWLDAVGHDPNTTSSDIHRVWYMLKEKATAAATANPTYKLNRNHYHAVIEAYVRIGDVSAAWDMVCGEMRGHGFAPDLMTFYTLVAPLASSSTLWPIGKSVVTKFKMHYPDIVDQAVKDASNTLIVKALLRQALRDSTTPVPSI